MPWLDYPILRVDSQGQETFLAPSADGQTRNYGSECLNRYMCVSPFPELFSVARVNAYRTTDVTRVLKAPGAELCQNACGVVNEQKIFCSHQCIYISAIHLKMVIANH